MLEAAILEVTAGPDPCRAATTLLRISEEVLEHWISARGDAPTADKREGYRLLALHRQGTKGDPSFNACRETCREIVYHYNLVTMQPGVAANADRVEMMKMISNHLLLFISGKLQVAELGEFCCSSRPIRSAAEADPVSAKET